MPRGRIENLKPFTSNQDREAARRNGRKGGIASGKVRAEKARRKRWEFEHYTLKPWNRYLQKSTFGKLRIKHQNFIYAYALCGNASEAARQAGYSPRHAREIGCRILKRADVQQGIYFLGLAIRQEKDPAKYGLLELEDGTLLSLW